MGILFATPTRHKLRKPNRHETSVNAMSFLFGNHIATALINATQLPWHLSMSALTHETTGRDWRNPTMVLTSTWDGTCYKREFQFLCIVVPMTVLQRKRLKRPR